MNTRTPDHRDPDFAIGVLNETFVGAGLMMWVAPRPAVDLRQTATDSPSSLAETGEAIEEITG